MKCGYIPVCLALISGMSAAHAQHAHCYSTEAMQQLSISHPDVYESIEHYRQAYFAGTTSSEKINSDTATLIIPVVVHVVYHTNAENIDDESIYAQIRVLNADYQRQNADTADTPDPFQGIAANCHIAFCLAETDPGGSPSTGITRTYTDTTVWPLDHMDDVKNSATGGADPWPSSEYMNVWVCNLSPGILGYGYPPGAGALDGIVVGYRYFGLGDAASAPYDLGRTATHEVGHWLGLSHPWGDDGGSCSGTDHIDDTPNQADATYGCPAFPRTDGCTSDFPGVVFMDYMDYTNDACMNMFTTDQMLEMRHILENDRLSILSSPAGCNVLPLPPSSLASLTVYPNPNAGTFAFDISDFEGSRMQVEIFDALGQKIAEKDYPAAQTLHDTFTMPEHHPGCYVIRAFNGTYFLSTQFMIL